MEEWREHKIETQRTDIPVLIIRMNHWKKCMSTIPVYFLDGRNLKMEE
jgi:hypothetical protein